MANRKAAQEGARLPLAGPVPPVLPPGLRRRVETSQSSSELRPAAGRVELGLRLPGTGGGVRPTGRVGGTEHEPVGGAAADKVGAAPVRSTLGAGAPGQELVGGAACRWEEPWLRPGTCGG